MNNPTTIVVTPFCGEGFQVVVNGERTATFDNGGVACAAYAQQLLRVRELEQIIMDHTSFLHSRTHGELGKLGTPEWRAIATATRTRAGLEDAT